MRQIRFLKCSNFHSSNYKVFCSPRLFDLGSRKEKRYFNSGELLSEVIHSYCYTIALSPPIKCTKGNFAYNAFLEFPFDPVFVFLIRINVMVTRAEDDGKHLRMSSKMQIIGTERLFVESKLIF